METWNILDETGNGIYGDISCTSLIQKCGFFLSTYIRPSQETKNLTTFSSHEGLSLIFSERVNGTFKEKWRSEYQRHMTSAGMRHIYRTYSKNITI